MKYFPEILAVGALGAVLAVAMHMLDGGRNPHAAAGAPPTTDNSFAIRGVRVFDGERVLPMANVVVRDGLIATVGADAGIPDGIDVLDGSGKTLLPGLIDAHTHSWGDARRDALRFGVTTELDMMGDWKRIPALHGEREALARTDAADLWTAGAAVTAPGGHGTQYGMDVPTLAAGGDAGAFVAARVDEGSDYIKLIVEDMGVYEGTRRLPTIAPDQVTAAIAAAHARDRIAVVHASSQANARQAVAAGADGLVHVFQDAVADDAFLAEARAGEVFVVPTLSVIAMIAGAGEGRALADDARLSPWLASRQVDSLQGSFGGPPRAEFLQRALDSVRRLHAAGVAILAGTDAGNPGTAHGASLHGELGLLVRAGLTPVQALAAATSLPAKRFGLADRGRIAPGLRADLLLVEGDPTHDIAATRAIVAIWKNGYAIVREPTATASAAASAPAEPVPGGTLVSDFDGDSVDSRYGSGWQATTDAMAGGASTADFALVPGGAMDSRGALEISGEIKAGFAYPWAGAMFLPARQPMRPVDLSQRRTLAFQVRGDGRRYTAMLISGDSMQAMPAMQGFTAGPDWQDVRLPLSGFAGADLRRVRAIAFAAMSPPGAFRFRIDQVEVE